MLNLLLLYLLSIAISYLGIRYSLIEEELNPVWMLVLVMLVPIYNVVWGAICFISALSKKVDGEHILRKFFRM